MRVTEEGCSQSPLLLDFDAHSGGVGQCSQRSMNKMRVQVHGAKHNTDGVAVKNGGQSSPVFERKEHVVAKARERDKICSVSKTKQLRGAFIKHHKSHYFRVTHRWAAPG